MKQQFSCTGCKSSTWHTTNLNGMGHLDCPKNGIWKIVGDNTLTPRKLARALKKNGGAIRATARELKINQYYVSRWLKHSEEPNNAEVRKRMGFPPLRKKHDGRSGFAELPPHLQWWRKLPKGERDQWIQRAHSAKLHTDEVQGEYHV